MSAVSDAIQSIPETIKPLFGGYLSQPYFSICFKIVPGLSLNDLSGCISPK